MLGLLLGADARAQAQFNLQPAGPGSIAVSAQWFGVWGTPAQCAAHRAGRFDNPSRYPYEISDEWIGQGDLYCYLRWLGEDSAGAGLTVYADAQCGEDTLRDYRLLLRLRQQRLRITWSPDFTTGELRRCDAG